MREKSVFSVLLRTSFLHVASFYCAKCIETNLIYYDVLNLNEKRVNKKRILISTALAFSIPVTRPHGYRSPLVISPPKTPYEVV